ncbi:hypothetical protein VTI74DRAFT_5698 [Chaetomium olivicolor]
MSERKDDKKETGKRFQLLTIILLTKGVSGGFWEDENWIGVGLGFWPLRSNIGCPASAIPGQVGGHALLEYREITRLIASHFALVRSVRETRSMC